jgi:PhnB protein
MKLGKSLLMLGSPGRDFKNPKLLGGATLNLYVDVDNVDKHHAQAVKAGARIVEEPKDTFYGARRYGAEDPEGHQWYFAEDLSKPAKRARRASTPTRKKTKGRGRKRSSK